AAGPDQQPPPGGNGDDGLDHYRAGDEDGCAEADDGDHGNHGIPEDVEPGDSGGAGTLGVSGADVIVAVRLEEAGAGEPGDVGNDDHAQSHRREDELLEGAVARCGQPSEAHRNGDDQHQPQPEAGHGASERGEGGGDGVDDAPTTEGCDAAEDDRHRDADEESETGEPWMIPLRTSRPRPSVPRTN